MSLSDTFISGINESGENMKYVIIIDSVATLPEYVIKQRPIEILPVEITIDGKSQPDILVERELDAIYSGGVISTNSEIDTTPPSEDEIHSYIIEKIAPNYDYAVCQTTSAANSPIFGAFKNCANNINIDAKKKRNSLGIQHPFYMSYVNSETSNAGQGLLALYADAMLSKGVEFSSYRENVEKFKRAIRTYTVVKDVLYTRNRAKRLGIESIALPTAFIGQLMGVSPIIRFTRDTMTPLVLKPGYEKAVAKVCLYAIEQINQGLFLNFINVAYAGPLSDLDQISEFGQLKKVAQSKKVKLIIGMMSLCGCINYSPGSFSLGIAPKDQTADPS